MCRTRFRNAAAAGLVYLIAVLVSACGGGTEAGEGSPGSNGKNTTETPQRIVPIAVDQSYLDGIGLVAADISIVERKDTNVTSERPIEHSSHVFHLGKIMVAVYESAPGKVHIQDARFDEFVHILKGRLILTLSDGESFEFRQGDSLIVPKGYTGYWEMPEQYRELIVIDTDYMNAEK